MASKMSLRASDEGGITFAAGFRHILLNPKCGQCSSGKGIGIRVPREIKSFRTTVSCRIRFRYRTILRKWPEAEWSSLDLSFLDPAAATVPSEGLRDTSVVFDT